MCSIHTTPSVSDTALGCSMVFSNTHFFLVELQVTLHASENSESRSAVTFLVSLASCHHDKTTKNSTNWCV